jgi:magnesium-transporting ATPase (P-type)
MANIPLIITAIVTFLGIVISSIILGIVNTVSAYLEDTDYDNLIGDCEESKQIIFQILDEDIGRLRWLNGIMLAIFILLFIMTCVGIYFSSREKDINEVTNESVKPLGTLFFSGGFFLYVILGLLFVIFLIYTIFYGIMLGRINNVDADCFPNDTLNLEKSKLTNFNRAKNLILVQFVTCFIMLLIVSILIGSIIFYRVRSSKSKSS